MLSGDCGRVAKSMRLCPPWFLQDLTQDSPGFTCEASPLPCACQPTFRDTLVLYTHRMIHSTQATPAHLHTITHVHASHHTHIRIHHTLYTHAPHIHRTHAQTHHTSTHIAHTQISQHTLSQASRRYREGCWLPGKMDRLSSCLPWLQNATLCFQPPSVHAGTAPSDIAGGVVTQLALEVPKHSAQRLAQNTCSTNGHRTRGQK